MPELQFYLDVLETVLGPVMLAVAGVVYAASPRSWANRSLAIFIFVEGLTFGGVGNGVSGLVGGRLGRALFETVVFGFAFVPSLYLWFTSSALDNFLTRPLRRPAGLAGLAAFSLAGCIYYFAVQPSFLVAIPFLLAASLYALAAAWVSSRAGGDERRRANGFLLAFLLRDIAILGIALGYAVGPGTAFQQLSSFWWSVVYAAFPFLAAYAVLRGQLVDLDHRARLAISRSMAVTVIVVAFFVASELASDYVSHQWGTWVGLAVAAAIALAGRPLQALGMRLARAMLPASDDAAAVYREQFAIAASDGRLGDKERRGLDALAARLGLSASQVARIEAGARGAPTRVARRLARGTEGQA